MPERIRGHWVPLLAGTIIVVGILLGAGLFWVERSLSERFDMLIIGGLVVDGTGAPAEEKTIGIRDGRIVPVEWPSFAEAGRRIDASGLVVAPGFIDTHTHIEGNVRAKRKDAPLAAPNFVAQGITTIITGNCGTSAQSLSQFFTQLESGGIQVNVGSLVGHNTIRRQVMGEDSREPTIEELNKMRQLVHAAMREGALGLSTGLEYTPGTYATQKEIESLAAVARQYDGIYATHMRDEGNGVIKSLEEAVAVARNTGIRLQVSHLKVRGRANWGISERLLGIIDEARLSGIQVWCDIYPYTASSTSLEILIPKEARAGGPKRLRQRLGDPQERSRIIDSIIDQMKREGWQDFSFARVAYCHFAPEYNGLTIPQIAKLLDRPGTQLVKTGPGRSGNSSTIVQAISVKQPKESATSGNEAPMASKAERAQKGDFDKRLLSEDQLRSQAEAICYLTSRGGAQMIYENMSERDMMRILSAPYSMIGSDSGIRSGGVGLPHPRGFGSAPRFLSRLAIEMKSISLEEAVRKMTSLPADTFHIPERGRILDHSWADIVIFDPDTIKDQATYESPLQWPTGILYVIINGELVVDKDEVLNISPGKVITKLSQ